MSVYRPASPEILALLAEVTALPHNTRLIDADVAIGCETAHARLDREGNPKGSALKHHGSACLALIRIVSHKDRVAGLPDAIVYLDGDRWDEHSREEQIAAFDHELAHLLPVIKKGKVKLDDCGRPKLKMRQHDYELGGFWDITERHRENAIERMEFARIQRKMTQMEFAWSESEEPAGAAR